MSDELTAAGSRGNQADSQFQVASTVIGFRDNAGASRDGEAARNDESDSKTDRTVTSDGALQRKADPAKEVSLPDRLKIPLSQVATYIEAAKRKLMQSVAAPIISYFELGDQLTQHARKLDPVDFRKLCKDVDLSRSHVENVIRVACAPNLRKPEFQPYLPLALGSLIDLANDKKWSERAIKDCINVGLLNRSSTRAQLKKWIDERSPKEETPQVPEVGTHIYEAGAVLYFHRSLSRNDKQALEGAIQNWNPPGLKGGESREGSEPFVVLLKTAPRDVKSGTFDRYCDENGYLVHEDGALRSPTRIRRSHETVELEQWDDSLGVRPGDKV